MQLFAADVEAPVLNAMTGAGAEWARTRILWSVAEPVDRFPPVYSWTYVDGVLIPLVARGLTPIVGVYNNPSWAATTSCGPVDRVPLSRFELFVEALVERYDGDGVRDAPGSPVIRHWEISNEPDFDRAHAGGEPDNGGCFGSNPGGFGAHLRAAYLGAKAASPQSVVIFGGVAYERFFNKAGYSPAGPFDYGFVKNTIDWLHNLYAGRSGWPYFDWMAVHVYNDFRNNWDGAVPYDQELIGKVREFRSAQLVHPGLWDVRDKPLALTEASLPSMPADTWTARSEALQAVYPGRLFARAKTVGAAAVVWYSVEDSTRGNCDQIYDWLTFGILRSMTVYQAAQGCPSNPLPDYVVGAPHQPKPARDAYAAASAAMGAATFDRQLTPAETGSPAIEAYRYVRPAGRYLIVAFTDNGERLGRVGYPPLVVSWTVTSAVLPDWTGSLRITDHLGAVSHHANVGAGYTLALEQAPVYVEAE